MDLKLGESLVNKNRGSFSAASLKRGEQYFQSRCVENLSVSPNKAEAIVYGTYNYKVSIEFKNGFISKSHCSCPFNSWGLCKHVAAVLYALDEKGGEAELGGDREMRDYELFEKESRNLSVRVRNHGDADAFFALREQELIKRKENWTLEETVEAVIDLYCTPFPLARYIHPDHRVVPFLRELNLGSSANKAIIAGYYKKRQSIEFLSSTMFKNDFRGVVNELIRDAFKAGREKYGYQLFYNLGELYPYFEIETYLTAIRYGTNLIDFDELVDSLNERNEDEVFAALIGSSVHLSPSSHLRIAEYFERKGETGKAKEEYRKLIFDNVYCDFACYIDYWKALDEDERKRNYQFLSAKAAESKRLKPFKILTGQATKTDFKGLPLPYYSQLKEEIKGGYAGIYAPYLVDAVKKELSSQTLDDGRFNLLAELFTSYDFLLGSLIDEADRLNFHSLETSSRRMIFLSIARKKNLLPSFGLHIYEEGK